jgi:hypothetical protein
MKKKAKNNSEDDLRPEYDPELIRGGTRGKYVARYREGTNLVLLAPDVAKAFPTESEVNSALRMLIRVAGKSVARK